MHQHSTTSRTPRDGGDSPRPRARWRRTRFTLIVLIATLASILLAAPNASAARAPQAPRNGAIRPASPAAQTTTAPLTLSPPFLFDGQEGQPYSQQFSASGGTAPYTFAASFSPRPIPGLSFTGDGLLSGTPTDFGDFWMSVTVTDARGESAGTGYALKIITPIAISPPRLPDGKVASAYSQSLAASGGAAPYTFVMASGTLPPGLSLSANGTLSGTPGEAGEFGFIVAATDARGIYGDVDYRLMIAPPFSISPGWVPNGEVGVAYNQTIAAGGGTAPYTFAVTGGALPPGLSLSSAGALKGTPSAGGYFFFNVTATDARGLKSSQSYNLWINQIPLTLNPSGLPGGQPGVPYSQRITASGGTSPYTFAVSEGALPPGLTLGRDGQLSGKPTTEGVYAFRVTATDARGRTGTNYYGLVIAMSPLTIGPDSLPNGKVGVDYRQRLTASGGNAPYTFAAASTLPPGLTLRSDGRILGRPTAAGSFYFEISVKDARGRVGGKTYFVAFEQAFALAPASLPSGLAGTPYAQTITASGGRAPYTFAVTDGALPAGLTLSSAGLLSGTPTSFGSSFAITASDSRGVTSAQVYWLNVSSPIAVSPPDLPIGKVGGAYHFELAASGGVAPYSFAVVNGALPPGLTLNQQGALDGTPTVDDNYYFMVEVTDSRGIAGWRSYSVAIAQALYVSPPYLNGGTVGKPYAASLSAGGGSAPYTFAVTDGTLPPGLTLSTDGALTGTPTAEGGFFVTITATDAGGLTGRQSYYISIARPQIVVSPSTLPNGQVGAAYRQQLSASQGAAPYIFYADYLPGGLTLTANGLLQGTPSGSWDGSVAITVIDANGSRADVNIPLAIEPLAVTPFQLPNPVAGTAYNQRLAVGGGTAPYTFVLQYGSLPDGIRLSRDGTLSGAPTAGAGSSFYFQVRAIDANGYAGQQNYQVSVVDPLALSAASLPDGTVGAAYSASLSATGGTSPYAFAVTSGALPPGLTLNPDGTIDGAPSLSGAYSFTVTVTDFDGQTAARSFAIAVG